MRRFILLSLGLMLLMAGSLFAQTDTGAAKKNAASAGPALGRWKMDTAASDFGGMPAPKSMTVTVTKDTPKMLAWRSTGTDADGTSVKESWSGPKDGTMRPVTGSKEGEQWSFKDTGNGNGDVSTKTKDGASAKGTLTLSDDKKTYTEESSGKTKDGKDFHQKIVWKKVEASSKPASSKQ
jgi:hypothetical protein